MSSLIEIRSDAVRRVVVVVWSDDLRAELPHALLRRRCACAQCRQARRSAECSIAHDGKIERPVRDHLRLERHGYDNEFGTALDERARESLKS